MIRAHVIYDGLRWSVRVLGETLHRSVDPVRAERVAHDYVAERDGGEVVVHRADDTLRRVPIRGRPTGRGE